MRKLRSEVSSTGTLRRLPVRCGVLLIALASTLTLSQAPARASARDGHAGADMDGRAFETLQIQSVVESRFRRLASRGGIRVRCLGSNRYECTVRVAPAHDPAGRPRLWRRTELARMVRATVQAVHEAFPAARVAESTRVEAPIPGVRAPLTVTLGDLQKAQEVEQVDVEDLLDEQAGSAGEPEIAANTRGSPTSGRRILMHPEAGGSVGLASGSALERATLGAPAIGQRPASAGSGQADAPGLSLTPTPGTVTSAQATGGPAAGVPVLGTAGGSPPATRPAPSTGRSAGPSIADRWRAEREIPPSAPQSGLTTGLIWPRDAEAVEWAVERAVTSAIKPNWSQMYVRSKLLRPRLIRVNVRIVVSGAQAKDNLSMLLSYVRDAIYTVMHEQFPGLTVFGRSRIEIVEQTGGLVRSYRLVDMTPVVDDINPPDPFFRPIACERARVVDLPRAWPLPPRVTTLELRMFDRHVVSGVFSNVSLSRADLYGLTLRKSFFENLELSIGALTFEQTVQPTAKGIFTNSPSGLFAATFGAKYMLPYQINGMNLSVGIDQSFQPGSDRQFYLPDEFERMYDVYAVASGRLWENLLLHLAAQQTFVTEKPVFPDASITTLGMGLEYCVDAHAVIGLELKYDGINPSSVANFGAQTAGSGLLVNVLGVIGSAIGDIELSIRKLNVPEWKEVGLGLAYRF